MKPISFFLYLFAMIVLISQTVFSQSRKQKIDSLLELHQQAPDSTWYQTHYDASFYYLFNSKSKADSLIEISFERLNERPNAYWETTFNFVKGVNYDVNSNKDSAQYYFKKTIDLAEAGGFKSLTLKGYNGLGMNSWGKGDYTAALEYFFKALEGNLHVGDKKSEASFTNNIGLIYQEMALYDKALEYHQKSLDLRTELEMIYDIPKSLNNMAICYREKGLFETALKSINTGLLNVDRNDNIQDYYDLTSTKSNILANLNRYDEAIPLLLELKSISEDNSVEAVLILTPYSNLINAYNSTNRPEKSLEIIKQAYDQLSGKDYFENQAHHFYMNEGQTYFMLSKPLAGEKSIGKAIRIRDSIFSAENAGKVAEFETKFGLVENELMLEKTRADLAETELEVRNKRIQIYGTMGLTVIFGLIGYLFYSRQRLKNRQLKKEGELKEALSKIETQNKLQEQRLRISRDLHDNIGSQLTFVTSSIDNLKYGIEDSDSKISTKLAKISDFTTQTIYELRDTIWAMNKSQISFEDLQSRIANFIDKARASDEKVSFNFTVAPEIDVTSSFTSVEGMNIYRIIQEAVNNSLKYAKASNIEVRINSSEAKEAQLHYSFEIIDDGIGFDLKNSNLGNGLNNMKKRAKDLGGTLEIDATLDNGTRIILVF